MRTILILLTAGVLLANTAEAQTDRSRGDRCVPGRSNVYTFTTPHPGTAVPYEVLLYYNQSRVRVVVGLFNMDVADQPGGGLGTMLATQTETRFVIGRAGLRPAERHELWVSCVGGAADYRLLSSVQTGAPVRWSRRYPFDPGQAFDPGEEARRLDVERFMEALLAP